MTLHCSCRVSVIALSLFLSIVPAYADDTSTSEFIPPATEPVVLEDNQKVTIYPNFAQKLASTDKQNIPILVVDGIDVAEDERFMDSNIDIVISAGGVFAPDYEGSDNYKVTSFPIIQVNYQDLIFFDSAQQSLAINVLGRGDLRFGPLVKLDLGRDQDDNSALYGLGDVNFSIELGGYVEYNLPDIAVEASLVKDVLAGHQDWLQPLALAIQNL